VGTEKIRSGGGHLEGVEGGTSRGYVRRSGVAILVKKESRRSKEYS